MQFSTAFKTKIILTILVTIIFFLGLAVATPSEAQKGKPKPTPTPTPVPTATPTPSPLPSPSPTATPTPTPSPSPEPTPSPSPEPTPTPTPVASPTPAPQTLSIYTANLQHGQGTDGKFNFDRQVNILSTAQIVGAQEVTPGDLPNWDSKFAAKGLTRAIYFPNSSINDGQAIWSSLPVDAVYSHKLSDGFISWDGSTDVDKSAVAIVITINSKQILVVNTHLCWSRCANSQADITTGNSWQRDAQATELLNWTASLGYSYVVILGDMNFIQSFPQYSLFANYVDVWLAGVQAGTATANWGDRDNNGVLDMPLNNIRTSDTRRIDYFFLSPNLSIVSIDLPDLREPCPVALTFSGAVPSCNPYVLQQSDTTEDFGIRPADHNWMKLVIRP